VSPFPPFLAETVTPLKKAIQPLIFEKTGWLAIEFLSGKYLSPDFGG
jgi:hypothetical protein